MIGEYEEYTSLDAGFELACTKCSANLIFVVVASVPKLGPLYTICNIMFNDKNERNSFHVGDDT